MRNFEGRVWRHIPVGAVPLHLGWILRAGRGRWNTQRPRLPCLYTSLRPQGAIGEYQKHLAEYGHPKRRDLVSLDVSVRPVLDLTSARIRQRLGVSLDTLTGDTSADLIRCRRIAREAVLRDEYCAILAPSASIRGDVNLMIYIESTRGIRSMMDGPDRITIDPAFRWP